MHAQAIHNIVISTAKAVTFNMQGSYCKTLQVNSATTTVEWSNHEQ